MLRRTLVALALTLPACADLTGPAPAVAGAWVGESQGIGARFVLAEEGGAIEGNGTILTGFGGASASVSGTRTWRALSLTLSSPGFPSASFIGVLTSSSIEGTFEAAATGPVRISLRRE